MNFGYSVANLSAYLVGASNNAAHLANGLAVLFMATGQDKAHKLIEIAAALVVAGELSLGASQKRDPDTGRNEWVDAYEKLGRNR